jgi:hypothetical protein
VSHSLPQLELLAAAANRLRAGDALLSMQTAQAAFGACQSKPGVANFKKLAAILERQAEGR